MKIEWGDSLFLIYTGIKCVYNVYLLDRMSSKKRKGGEAAPVDPIDFVSAISAFENVLDQIQANRVQKSANEREQYEQASQLNQEINGLKVRMFQEGIRDPGGKLMDRIDRLEKRLKDDYGLQFENIDPQDENTIFAASYLLSLWDCQKSLEYSQLPKPEKARLETILQEVLPVEAVRYLEELSSTLPMQLKQQKVNEELTKKMGILLANARKDMTAYFGVTETADSRTLNCLNWEEYEREPENDERLRLLRMAIHTSCRASLEETTFAENLSGIIQLAIHKPLKAFAAVGSSALAVTSAASFSPLVANAVGAASGAVGSVVTPAAFLDAIKVMAQNPGTTTASAYYLINQAPLLISGFFEHFGIEQDGPEGQEIRQLFDRMNADFLAYQKRGFVGPIPDSILNFNDALLSVYSLLSRTLYDQSAVAASGVRAIFKAPATFARFCKSTMDRIGMGFQSLAQFLRNNDDPLSSERRARFHDIFRDVLRRDSSGLSDTEEARARLVSLSLSDDREFMLFEARLDRHMAADARAHAAMYRDQPQTQMATTESPPHAAEFLAELEKTVPAQKDQDRQIDDEYGIPLERNPEPKTVNEGDRFLRFKEDVIMRDTVNANKTKVRNGSGGVAKRKSGGKRTARRKATTKKQKSKKNRRQSRRKVRRSSSRRSRK